MTTEPVYIPHHNGEVLGARRLAPWVADDLAQATTCMAWPAGVPGPRRGVRLVGLGTGQPVQPAGQVYRARRTLRARGDRQALPELVRLRGIAEQATTGAAVPAVAERTIAAAADAVGDETGRHGWQRAVDRVWSDALTAGAHDTVLATSMDIYTAWRAAAQPFDDAARIGNRDLPHWIRDTLADTNRAVAKQWRAAAASTPPPRASRARVTQWPGQAAPDEAVTVRRHPPGPSTDPPADLHARTGKAFTPLAVRPDTNAPPPGQMPPPDSTAPQRGRSR